MYGKVMIGNKEVEMLANAATPYRYQTIFKEDFFSRLNGEVKFDLHDIWAKMGYVMAMQAQKADMSKLNMDTFLAWLEGFETSAVFNAANDIGDIYNGTQETSVDPKSESGQPNEG